MPVDVVETDQVSLHLDGPSCPGFDPFPPISREQDTTDIDGLVRRHSAIFSSVDCSGHRNETMLVLLRELSVDNAREVQERIHHGG